MPTEQNQAGVYSRPFHVVTASRWDKYEGHPWIKDVEVIYRHVDADGCLRSRRLLTMSGKIPIIFRPFFGSSTPFYMIEDVTIDMKSLKMEVRLDDHMSTCGVELLICHVHRFGQTM